MFQPRAKASPPREVETASPPPPLVNSKPTPPVERAQQDVPPANEMKPSDLDLGATETPVPAPASILKAESVAPSIPSTKASAEDAIKRTYRDGGQVTPTNREIPDNVVLLPGLLVQQKLDDSGVYVVAQVMDDSPDGYIVSRRLDTQLVQRVDRKHYFLAPDEIDQPYVLPHHRASLLKALQDGTSYSPFGSIPPKNPRPIRKVVVTATPDSTETDMNNTVLRVGDKVKVDWNWHLYNAEILSVEEGDQCKIHYSGFSESWHEKVPRSRIKSMVRD
jgi:hypothetical protein